MTFFEAVISGIVQGITEFLPVSSSGHLVILHHMFGVNEPQVFFDIFLHLGTLIAIFIVFWRDIVDLFYSKKKNLIPLLIGTIVTVGFVLIFKDSIENIFASTKIVGFMLIVTGAWLIVGSFIRFGGETLSGFKAAIVGLAQGIASIPGISRSGATISTGMFLGLSSKAAARFSFLLCIPAIIGAFILKAKSGSMEGFNINYIVGLITSCIIGVLSLKLLLRMLFKDRLWIFSFYCIILGVVVIFFL
ncbi:MAG: undecaprenyl-diphosphate phosphatase [Candidatus Omnitrophota bacterium]